MRPPPGFQPAVNPLAAVAGHRLTGIDAGLATEPRYGMTMWFNVTVPRLDTDESISLGSWSGCSGLAVKLTPEGPIEEGGSYGAQRYLSGKVSYPEITLERAMTTTGAKQVQAWLQELTTQWANPNPPSAVSRPVVIELRSGLGAKDVVIHTWELRNAVPTGWTLPTLSTVGTGSVATEKLTLAHSGFLEPVEPVADNRLVLVERDNQVKKLSFLANPAKISVTKSREAESKNARIKEAGTVLVDPNSLAVTISDLRLEGWSAISSAIPLLRRWVELEDAPAAPSVPPPSTEGTNPPECSKCKKKMPSASTETAAGSPRVLRVLWGQGRGGLPRQLILKSFTLNATRFTPSGQPSRATLNLTLQEAGSWVEATPQVRPAAIGSHRSGEGRRPAIGAHRPPTTPAWSAGTRPAAPTPARPRTAP